MTDCACTAKIKHIILLENGGRLCMNSIHPKTKLLNAQDQPSGAGVENSAKLIQILCDRCTVDIWPNVRGLGNRMTIFNSTCTVLCIITVTYVIHLLFDNKRCIY